MKVNSLWNYIVIAFVALLIAMPAEALVKDSTPAFSQEELDQILAPIALYPDSLLAQILMGSTYPLEIVMADRWVKENSDLQGDALNDALDQRNWDPSVKALVPFPNILSMMSEELDWTERVGEAFLAQEVTVMDTIQELRARAYEAGTLTSSQHLEVSREDDTIIIEPYDPRVIYVPVYDPWEVYGPWWWPHYPPYVVYRYPSNLVVAPGIVWFGTGFSVGTFWSHGWGYWDWGHRRCYVNVDRTININRTIIVNKRDFRTTPWKHNRKHRRNVAYRVPATHEKYAPVNRRAADYKHNKRGYEQTRPEGKRSIVSRPAPKTKPSKKIMRKFPETRYHRTLIERSSQKTRQESNISRFKGETKSSKKIMRSSPKTRPCSTVIERSKPKTRPAIRASRPSTKTKSNMKIKRSTPKNRSHSTIIARSTPKVILPNGVSRPATKTNRSKKITRTSKISPDYTKNERPWQRNRRDRK